VVLDHAIQINQLSIQIVQHLDLRRLLALEVQGAAAGEHLDVALVLRKQLQQAFREAPLAAHSWNDWVCHFCNPLQGDWRDHSHAQRRKSLAIPPWRP